MPDRITAADIPPATKRAIGLAAAACGLVAFLLSLLFFYAPAG